MSRKLAVKKLTASDLTFFKWHFENNNAGNQKAINLNADVFITKLYPQLPEMVAESGGRIPLDLWMYGPGLKGSYNLQRKIVKFGTYKNWRLNGEFVPDPIDDLERFKPLKAGDFALFDFYGAGKPASAKLVLIAADVLADKKLHEVLAGSLPNQKMAQIDLATLSEFVEQAAPHEDHPVYALLDSAALEDIALGGPEGAKVLSKRKGRIISKDELLRARKSADETGLLGEELLNIYFAQLKVNGQLADFEWISFQNAISPYDFKIHLTTGSTVLLDAKSTGGEFERTLHVSVNELEHMVSGPERYDLYRLYEISETSAKLRIAENVSSFASEVLAVFKGLPSGVRADGISVDPATLAFGDEIEFRLPDNVGDED